MAGTRTSLHSLLLSWFLFTPATAAYAADASRPELASLQHIIVLYLENRNFDNLFGLFPGADGIQQKKGFGAQIGKFDNVPLPSLGAVLDNGKVDPRFPADLANAPFRLDPGISLSSRHGDLIHKFFTEQEQIHDGRMDRFVSWGTAGALPMGYYDGSRLKLWQLAAEFTLADHFFHAAFGGSFLNHFWLVCACAPEVSAKNLAAAPELKNAIASFDDAGHVQNDDIVWDRRGTKDAQRGIYAVNTIQSVQFHKQCKIDNQRKCGPFLEPQTHPTIGDELDRAGISWTWYSGGWAKAVAGNPDDSFQFHHQPFAYFAHWAPGTPDASKNAFEKGIPILVLA